MLFVNEKRGRAQAEPACPPPRRPVSHRPAPPAARPVPGRETAFRALSRPRLRRFGLLPVSGFHFRPPRRHGFLPSGRGPTPRNDSPPFPTPARGIVLQNCHKTSSIHTLLGLSYTIRVIPRLPFNGLGFSEHGRENRGLAGPGRSGPGPPSGKRPGGRPGHIKRTIWFRPGTPRKSPAAGHFSASRLPVPSRDAPQGEACLKPLPR